MNRAAAVSCHGQPAPFRGRLTSPWHVPLWNNVSRRNRALPRPALDFAPLGMARPLSDAGRLTWGEAWDHDAGIAAADVRLHPGVWPPVPHLRLPLSLAPRPLLQLPGVGLGLLHPVEGIEARRHDPPGRRRPQWAHGRRLRRRPVLHRRCGPRLPVRLRHPPSRRDPRWTVGPGRVLDRQPGPGRSPRARGDRGAARGSPVRRRARLLAALGRRGPLSRRPVAGRLALALGHPQGGVAAVPQSGSRHHHARSHPRHLRVPLLLLDLRDHHHGARPRAQRDALAEGAERAARRRAGRGPGAGGRRLRHPPRQPLDARAVRSGGRPPLLRGPDGQHEPVRGLPSRAPPRDQGARAARGRRRGGPPLPAELLARPSARRPGVPARAGRRRHRAGAAARAPERGRAPGRRRRAGRRRGPRDPQPAGRHRERHHLARRPRDAHPRRADEHPRRRPQGSSPPQPHPLRLPDLRPPPRAEAAARRHPRGRRSRGGPDPRRSRAGHARGAARRASTPPCPRSPSTRISSPRCC